MNEIAASLLTAALIFGTLAFESWRSKEDRKALEARNKTIEALHTRLVQPITAAAVDQHVRQQVDLLEAQMQFEGAHAPVSPSMNGTSPPAQEDLMGGMSPRDIEDIL